MTREKHITNLDDCFDACATKLISFGRRQALAAFGQSGLYYADRLAVILRDDGEILCHLRRERDEDKNGTFLRHRFERAAFVFCMVGRANNNEKSEFMEWFKGRAKVDDPDVLVELWDVLTGTVSHAVSTDDVIARIEEEIEFNLDALAEQAHAGPLRLDPVTLKFSPVPEDEKPPVADWRAYIEDRLYAALEFLRMPPERRQEIWRAEKSMHELSVSL